MVIYRIHEAGGVTHAAHLGGETVRVVQLFRRWDVFPCRLAAIHVFFRVLSSLLRDRRNFTAAQFTVSYDVVFRAHLHPPAFYLKYSRLYNSEQSEGRLVICKNQNMVIITCNMP